MSALLRKTRTGFFVAMIGLLVMSVMAPVLTLANDDLKPGDDAVALRDSYLYSDYRDDANIEAEVAADTPVTVEDGPLYSPLDGTPWYEVRIFEERIGYMPGVDLEGEAIDTTPAETTEPVETEEETTEPSAPALPWQQPIDFGVATADVTCRGATSTEGTEITIVAANATVEITGAEVWAEGIGWTPVNCAGVGGYIASDYITRAVETEEATAPVAEEPVAEEPVSETVAEQPVEEAAVEEPVVEEPVTNEAVEETTTQTEQATTDETVTQQVAEAPAPAVQPALDPIATAWAAQAVNCRVAPTVESEPIAGFAAGDAVPVTGEAFAAEGFTWTPVNCGGVGGFVASDFLAWEDPATAAEAPAEEATEVATKPVEAATEVATEPVEVATEVATEPVEATEVATEPVQNATEVATEPAVEVAEQVTEPTEEVAGEATEVPAEPTEEIVEESTEEAAGPVEATPDVATEAATEELTEESVEDATQVATEAATEEATAPAEDAAAVESGVAVEETESTVPVEDDAILGTAEITGTNGLGLACRVAPDPGAAVITTLPEGMGVFVLAEPDANGWMSIVCADQVGYAPAHYLYSGGAASDFTSSSPSLGTVNSTGGAGLNCRSGPGTNHSIIGYFPAGSSVNVRGGAQGDWVPVVCGGNQQGWVHGDFLVPASAPSGSTGSGSTSSTGTATVVNTSGDSLRCRSGAGTSYSIITNLAPNSTVSLRSGSQGDWQAVICAGQNGFAHSNYLSVGGGGDNTPDTGNQPPSSGTVTVTGTGGARLNCRTGSSTSYPAVTSVAEGTVLSVRGAAQSGWLPVVCNGSNLWVSGDYVTAGGTAPQQPAPTPAPSQPSGLANGDHARTTANLNLRYDPYVGNNVAAVAPEGTVVLITGGHAGSGYYPVNWDGLKGYMHGDYLTETSAALSERGGSGAPTSPPTSGGGGTATGNAIVDFAMGYLGYPYVWATHGPASFDCSGFTYWVIYNVTGKNIWYGLWTQISAGVPVSRSALQPGDLVFFQNTYKAGLSHVGIYIGNNKFIHSQNEATGVVISDLDSSYYGPRWYGARRIH